MRLPIFLNLTTSEAQQICETSSSFQVDDVKNELFCKTSSVFQVDNIKNEGILRDFLQTWKVECRAHGLVPMRFPIFALHLSKVLSLPRKSDAKWSAAPVTQHHLSKLEDLMLQNATHLRKSAPWLPNSSDEHVSRTAPATRKTSCRSSAYVPRLPSF